MADTHPKKERTFVLIKHDGIQRSLVGDIINRVERTGLKLVGLKMVVATREQAEEHYNKDDAWCEKVGGRTIENLEKEGKEVSTSALEYGREILNKLFEYFTAGPVVAMAFEGNQSVAIVRKIVGDTEPLSSDVGTIRGDLTIDSYTIANSDNRAVRNLIHCSEIPEDAERELALWFDESELIKYTHINERMLYDINLDGILE